MTVSTFQYFYYDPITRNVLQLFVGVELNLVGDEAAFADALADEEPARDLDRDQGVDVSLLQPLKQLV